MSFVAGAGSINIDLLFEGLPLIPNEGEELYSRGFSLQMGGGVSATLLNLAGLGVPVRIQTGLGNDMFSDFARRTFASFGVEPYNLADGTTGIPLNISAALLTPSDRTFVSYTDGLPMDDARIYENSRGAKIVQMGVGSLEAYRRLKADGAILVFDTGWDDAMSLETYREYLELADYYTPNQKEALKITGTDQPADAARVLTQFFDKVIVKLDKDGCLILEDGQERIIPNIPVVHRDSTGAGDAFLAGFLYGLYHDYSFAQSVLFGNITGGTCVTAVGCLTARLTEDELLDLAEHYQPLLG